MAVAKGDDILKNIKLRINTFSKNYQINFLGEADEELTLMGQKLFHFKVLRNQERMTEILNIIGSDYFSATFYINNIPVVIGNFVYKNYEFTLIAQKAEVPPILDDEEIIDL
ncbi:hypothetical protein [uncultured Fusobacterium sp.]|uniref:hypothetical protein n=1 Tax=uncultured Fusobacterium sp. TaxID=159267 RepID=UPI0025E895C5|nr:hypothetical protein [uncultured Fusobacterium sp.]